MFHCTRRSVCSRLTGQRAAVRTAWTVVERQGTGTQDRAGAVKALYTGPDGCRDSPRNPSFIEDGCFLFCRRPGMAGGSPGTIHGSGETASAASSAA